MRARYDTNERLTLSERVAWLRTPASGNLVALYVGPDTERGEAATRALVSPARASRISGTLIGLAALTLTVAGVVASFVVSRRASPAPTRGFRAARGTARRG